MKTRITKIVLTALILAFVLCAVFAASYKAGMDAGERITLEKLKVILQSKASRGAV